MLKWKLRDAPCSNAAATHTQRPPAMQLLRSCAQLMQYSPPTRCTGNQLSLCSNSQITSVVLKLLESFCKSHLPAQSGSSSLKAAAHAGAALQQVVVVRDDVTHHAIPAVDAPCSVSARRALFLRAMHRFCKKSQHVPPQAATCGPYHATTHAPGSAQFCFLQATVLFPASHRAVSCKAQCCSLHATALFPASHIAVSCMQQRYTAGKQLFACSCNKARWQTSLLAGSQPGRSNSHAMQCILSERYSPTPPQVPQQQGHCHPKQ